MNTTSKCIYSKQNGRLQISYGEYLVLMEKVKEGLRIRQAADEVASHLQQFLDGRSGGGSVVPKGKTAKEPGFLKKAEPAKQAESAKPSQAVSVEFASIAKKIEPARKTEPAKPSQAVSVEFASNTKKAEPAKKAAPQPPPQPQARTVSEGVDIPPIKKDIVVHFNSLDDSGRLFSVFKQYYACLNDQCGGTVRVTMKDGFCSLWNYDEWEEFAHVDIFEGHLRFAVDPRYTDELKNLNFCEVPRLLSSRRNLVCVQVDDLNNIMLDVLTKAFNEVGLAAS